jgi:hypothetical protein
MRRLRPSSEAEMVALFLRTELPAARFRDELQALLERAGLPKRIVTGPDLDNVAENQTRWQLLTQHRGYGTRTGLFEGFPSDVRWEWMAITQQSSPGSGISTTTTGSSCARRRQLFRTSCLVGGGDRHGRPYGAGVGSRPDPRGPAGRAAGRGRPPTSLRSPRSSAVPSVARSTTWRCALRRTCRWPSARSTTRRSRAQGRCRSWQCRRRGIRVGWARSSSELRSSGSSPEAWTGPTRRGGEQPPGACAV